jgi:hypothetical protein
MVLAAFEHFPALRLGCMLRRFAAREGLKPPSKHSQPPDVE